LEDLEKELERQEKIKENKEKKEQSIELDEDG